MHDELLPLLGVRSGHFRYESGLHGTVRLALDELFVRPARLAPFVDALAARLTQHRPQVVCGPLTGGAWVAHAVASRLDLGFAWADRTRPDGAVSYRIPAAL